MSFKISLLILTFFALTSCGKPSSDAPRSHTPDTGSEVTEIQFSGTTWADALRDGRAILTALYVPAAGFAYEDADGRLTGVVVDILDDFAAFVEREHGVVVDLNFIEDTNWRRFYSRVVGAGDGVIGMGNVTMTEQRRNELHFSPPYMTNIAALITHRDTPELQRLSDLGDTFTSLQALAFEGTLHESRLRKLITNYYPSAEMAFATTNDEIIARVSATPGYFAYIDIYNYHRAAEAGIPVRRHPVGDESAEEFGYIMPLQTTWGAVIEEYFSAGEGLLNSERYRRIMTTHLGEQLTEMLLEP